MGSAPGGKRSRPRPSRPAEGLDGFDPEAGDQNTNDEDVFAAMADLGIGLDAVGESSREAYGRYLRQQKRCQR